MGSKRVLLLQLPVQSHDYEYSKENIPLALGYLKGFAQQFLNHTEISITPSLIANYGGDAAILDYIEKQAADIVGFGCTVWNCERTLHLCRRLKQRDPGILLVLGGPEVTADNEFLFDNGHFDFGILGEGEETFRDLLICLESEAKDPSQISGLAYRQARQWIFNHPRNPLQKLDSIPSPYLNGLISPSFLNTMALETVRGCPYRCAYCYYHKSYPKLRTFDLQRIEAELRWGLARGVEEVYFIDPCFARRPKISELLQVIRTVNQKREFRIQCELNAEDVTPELVQQLVLAGVGQVEVGLQSTNPEALQIIQRRFHEDSFIKGTRILKGMGIRVIVDLMVGLPGDKLEDVKRSIDFVVQNDLCDDLKIYPLSILPGTLLRKRAQDLGMQFQQSPPYLVVKTAEMGSQAIFQAFQYAEQIRGGDFFPPEIPVVIDGDSGAIPGRSFISQINVDLPDDPSSIDHLDFKAVGQSLSVYIKDPHWQNNSAKLQELLHPLLEANRFTLVNWVIPEELCPSRDALRALKEVSLWMDHPANREYFATHSPIRSTQAFILSRTGNQRDPIVLRTPLVESGDSIEGLPFLDVQRIYWVAFPPAMSHEEEERFLEKLIQRSGAELPGMRLADGPEDGFWNREDIFLRKVSVKL